MLLNLVQNGNVLIFDPPFTGITDAFVGGIEKIIDAVMTIPRLECQLYMNLGATVYLKPLIATETVEEYTAQIETMLDHQRKLPEMRAVDFDHYLMLINGKEENRVTSFLEENHTFEEYADNISNFKEIAELIPIIEEHVITVEMYEMNREELITCLVNAANGFKDRLLKRCLNDCVTACKALGEEYRKTADKLLTVPINTAELMALIKYSKEIDTVTIYEMEDRLRDIMKYILFLSDHILFTQGEIRQNNYTFGWYLKMAKILEENRQMIDVKIEEFQANLTARIQKFLEELELYATMVDELQYNGDIEELTRYYKKATQLDNRLIQAMERIDQFNEEEASYGFELSQYPLRKQTHDKLGPYKKLYDKAMEFLTKYELWMKSQVGSFDPEEIDNDVGQCYRNVYKLEKVFSDRPATVQLATTVRLQIEEFKEHMPIIQTLGNPGMKARHWEKISEIVGFPIQVDAELTLEKIIDYGLDEYVEEFEAISEAATKENNLEKNMLKMTAEWKDMDFTIHPYRDTGTFILSAVDDIQVLLDDHLIKTQTQSWWCKTFFDVCR